MRTLARKARTRVATAAQGVATAARPTPHFPVTSAATPRPDGWEGGALVSLTLVVFCLGLVEMYSASALKAVSEGLPAHFYVLKQLTAAVAGSVIAAILARIDYRQLRLWAWPMLFAVVVMLVVVIAPGTQAIAPVRNGARRWLDLGISFQPSELAKLVLIAWTAMMAVRKEDRLHSLSRGLTPFLVVWVPVVLLVFLEPNLSAALLIALLTSLVLFAGGARIGHFIALGIVAVPVILAKLDDAPYRVKRIAAFLDPSGDTQGIAYQINQSLIAIGSGGLGGVGFGNSRQKYGFLPEAHNDFLFSMIAEEWGLLGVAVVVALFAAFAAVGYRIASRASDRFGYLLAVGMTNLIVVTAFLHMGVAMALLPTTGFTLPFMSYGGSALLTYFIAVGVLLSIARAAKATPR
ncbi:MAG TPA: putative lipid II flippase FtsW [Longimicrobiaceae bacterium]|nr:putative lipid II flippase FtsW [Longimicrobiaceae bacterium]